jgi:ankyrin repeat protein
LAEAIAQDFYELIPLFQEYGCDFNKYCLGWHPLLAAAHKGAINCFYALARANVDIVEASAYDFREQLHNLPMSRAANAAATAAGRPIKTYKRTTVLHVLAKSRCGLGMGRIPKCELLNMIRTILKRCPPHFVYTRDGNGETALDIARAHGNLSSYEVMHSFFFYHFVLQSIAFSIGYELDSLVYSKVFRYLW